MCVNINSAKPKYEVSLKPKHKISKKTNAKVSLKPFQRLADFKGRAFGGAWGKAPHSFGHSAKGELKNSPVDCFERGNALQERAFPYFFS